MRPNIDLTDFEEWFSANTVEFDTYKGNRGISPIERATWLIENDYPVPTKNPLELAKILEEKSNEST